jgi:hypothetical protein
MSKPGSTAYGNGSLRRLEMGMGRTLTEDESIVDFLSALYVNYQAENCIELAGRERIGGGELRIEEAENLKEKIENNKRMVSTGVYVGWDNQRTANSAG